MKISNNMIKRMAEYEKTIRKIMKENKCTKVMAKRAMDIACDFNLQNEADAIDTCMIIIHTIKRIEED